MLEKMEERFYKVTFNGKYLGTVPWKYRAQYLRLCGIALIHEDDIISYDIDFKVFNSEDND